MSRQQKNCARCGTLVDIIPAGVSKKTGKPYGSFTKCKVCGNSEKIGVQPSYHQNQGNPYPQQNLAPQRNLGANPGDSKLVEHFNRLAERVAKLEQHLFGPKHLHATADELGDLPVVDLEPKDEIDPLTIPF